MMTLYFYNTQLQIYATFKVGRVDKNSSRGARMSRTVIFCLEK